MDGKLKLKMAIGLALSGVAFGIGAITLQQMSVADQLRVVPDSMNKGMTHILPAILETTQWGWFDNSQPPVLRVNAGDTVVLETMMHSHNQVVPGVTIEAIKKLRTDHPGRGPHTVTGPIYIDGAEPGDVLTVRINKIVPRAYGNNFNVPGMFGQFPKEFQDGQVKYFYLDLDRKVAEFAPGIEIPLSPFPGTLGVARAEPGRYSTVPPGPYAGNMDIRDLTAGTTLYVPVFVKGALLWTGDSHAAQGNGEINLTALETAYREMNITVNVIKDKGKEMAYPRIETPTHWITMGYDNDLNKAWADVRAETIKFITERRNVNAEKAAELMPQISDCRVSQVVNIKKGVHCLTPKDVKVTGIPERALNETAGHLATHAIDKDLNKAMDDASRGMLTVLQEKQKLSRLDAYGLASMTMDCRLGKISDESKAVHCMVPKSLWVAKK